MKIKEDVREEMMGVGIKEGEVKELSTEEEMERYQKEILGFFQKNL